MPILSDLSRRFHMLTTDAIPHPPRIEIKGYTHNLDPDDVNDKSKAVPATIESQFEQNDKTSSEEKKSVPNDAVPTNTRSSETKQNLDDTQSSATDAKQPKRPNVKTKTKSKYKHSQRAHVVNYNIVNSNGVKIGSRTSYICNINQFPTESATSAKKSWSKSKVRQMPTKVERLCTCREEITLDDIFIIKSYIGHGWKDVARKLLYSDGQIEQFEENYMSRGISNLSNIS
ncbi:death domain-containing immune deficiency protein isoform X2 [Ptiloglossa arizonensis]|uniref:death domain-containing immune deficiency protein isoform X2 n=1 Tax=Ptiloglossa arizonensis TaxID=3350558 RepID=UPI003FA13665